MGLFDFFSNKKHVGILGCGWLGKQLLEILKTENKYHILGSTTKVENKELLENSGCDEVIIGSLAPNWTGENDLKDVLSKLDYLVLDFPPIKSTDDYAHANQLSEIIKNLNTSTKVIYTSSTSIYKETGRIMLESDIKDVLDAASLKIYYAEEVLKTQLNKRVTILRCAGLTGKNRNLAKFFAGKTSLEGGSIPVNLVHGSDASRAILHCIEKNIWDKTYNIVAPIHPNKKTYYTDLCLKSNLSKPEFSDIVETIKYKEINGDLFIKETGFSYTFEDPMLFTYE